MCQVLTAGSDLAVGLSGQVAPCARTNRKSALRPGRKLAVWPMGNEKELDHLSMKRRFSLDKDRFETLGYSERWREGEVLSERRSSGTLTTSLISNDTMRNA
ncbi:Lon protease like mitochondrial, partial [Dissostichus eleginoides]